MAWTDGLPKFSGHWVKGMYDAQTNEGSLGMKATAVTSVADIALTAHSSEQGWQSSDLLSFNGHKVRLRTMNAVEARWHRHLHSVRRQNIWRNLRRRLAEVRPRLGFDVRRRSCGVASADVRWSVA